ncbi:MAG TPA: hypothetical protein VNT42_08660 [Sphingomonas sp.]|nr:hypothetical protein [Sphingomonas sp.]
MKYRLARTLRGYQPIYCLDDELILQRGRRLYRSDFELHAIAPLCTLPRERAIARLRSRLIDRIFRLGIQSAAMLEAEHLLAARRGVIYRVSLATGEWAVDLAIPNGRRLLNLSMIDDSATGRKALCFGEYSTLHDGSAVNVWRRDAAPDAIWQISATFAAGEIDHVHNICQVADGAIYILTGDYGDGAGIWKSDSALDSFTPIARGAQNVRACWIWQAPHGALYFATDSQFEPNHLRCIENGTITDVAAIAGSSISFGAGNERAIFSTAVEPGAVSGNRIRDILDRRPGPGMMSNEAALYSFENGELITICRAAKDIWPMRLAQFGTFQLPGGVMPPDRIYAFGVGLSGYDGRCLSFERAG